MGMKFIKIGAAILLFVVSFFIFLYWSFPYDVLRERLVTTIEQQIGGGIEVTMSNFGPYWFTGVDIRGLTINGLDASGKMAPLIECERATGRLSLFSLLFGRPHLSFDVVMGKGEIEGVVVRSDDALSIDADLDHVDLGHIKLIAARTGLQLSSRIDGEVRLRIDRQNPKNSTGKISIDVAELTSGASELKLSGAALPLPEFVIAHDKAAKIKMDMGKGIVTVESFRFQGGDIDLDLKGKIFLTTKVENYGLSLNGTFSVSKKLTDALPFLFIIEQQKQPDGNYPLSITGRLIKPLPKIGTFVVPL